MAKIEFKLDNLTVEQQYELLAKEMFEKVKGDIVEAIKLQLKESGGRGDRVGGSWSRSF